MAKKRRRKLDACRMPGCKRLGAPGNENIVHISNGEPAVTRVMCDDCHSAYTMLKEMDDSAKAFAAQFKEPLCNCALHQLKDPQASNAGDILDEMAETFRERNTVYGDNYKMVRPIMEILLAPHIVEFVPGGNKFIPNDIVNTDHFHLVELLVVKLTRFAVSGFKHADSIHDTGVYAAMIESILKGESK